MATSDIEDLLRKLKCVGMLKAFEAQQCHAFSADLSFEERLCILLKAEETHRADRRRAGLLKKANFKWAHADLRDLYKNPERNLDRNKISELATCVWIEKHWNVLITGKTGTGKTFLACALGIRACYEGHSVLFTTLVAFLDELKKAAADGSFQAHLKSLHRFELLILDDLGQNPVLDAQDCFCLSQFLVDWEGKGSLIVTSQLPYTEWHAYFSKTYKTGADAIMGRLTGNTTVIQLMGQSFRNPNDVMGKRKLGGEGGGEGSIAA